MRLILTSSLGFQLLVGWVLMTAANAFAVLPSSVDGEPLPSLAPMLARVTPAVVNIAVRGGPSLQRESPLMRDEFFKRFFRVEERGARQPKRSLGSGVVIDAERGLVVTNHHLLEGAQVIAVGTRDGRVLKGAVVGSDALTDLAVIKVSAGDLSAVTVADSDELRVGDFVVAIGNPFGLGQTVTSGIVSALSRSGLGIRGYEDFIQTDASINVGNSGGALVNLRGDLVGINTAIFSPSSGSVGIGFAIPANMVINIASQLISFGAVKRGSLGVEASDLSPSLAKQLRVESRVGVVIQVVAPNSAAAAAGLSPGDVLLQVNGRAVRNVSQVRSQLGALRAGEEVSLQVLRDGEEVLLAVILKPIDGLDEQLNHQRVFEGQQVHRSLSGAVLMAHRDGTGIGVKAVAAGSSAHSIGLQIGDTIKTVNQTIIGTPAELRAAMRQPTPITLTLLRAGHRRIALIR